MTPFEIGFYVLLAVVVGMSMLMSYQSWRANRVLNFLHNAGQSAAAHEVKVREIKVQELLAQAQIKDAEARKAQADAAAPRTANRFGGEPTHARVPAT